MSPNLVTLVFTHVERRIVLQLACLDCSFPQGANTVPDHLLYLLKCCAMANRRQFFIDRTTSPSAIPISFLGGCLVLLMQNGNHGKFNIDHSNAT